MAGQCELRWDDPTQTWIPTGSLNTCTAGYTCDTGPPAGSFPNELQVRDCVVDPASVIPTTSVGQYGASVMRTIDPTQGATVDDRVVITPDITQFTAAERTKGLTFAVKNATPSNNPWKIEANPSIAGTLIEDPNLFAAPAAAIEVFGIRHTYTFEWDDTNTIWLCRPSHQPETRVITVFVERDASTDINSIIPATIPLAYTAFDDRAWTVNGSGQLVANYAYRIVDLEAKVKVDCTTVGNNQQVQLIVSWAKVSGAGTINSVPGADFTQTSRSLSEPAIFTPSTEAIITGVEAGDIFELQGAVDASTNFTTVEATGLQAYSQVYL